MVFNPTGDEFLVVYTSSTPGVPEYVQAGRVAADGSGVGMGLTVASGTEARRNPDVAHNLTRDEYLVVYDRETSGANGYDIAATRLSGIGEPLGSGELTAYTSAGPARRPVVAACAARDEYLVLLEREWSPSDSDIYAVPIEGDGTAGPVSMLATSIHNEMQPAVSCDPDPSRRRYALAWQAGSEALASRIEGSLWTPDTGSFLDSHQLFAAADTAGLLETTRPTLAWGRSTLVAWEQDRGEASYQDIHARIIWPMLWGDGFECGYTTAWSDAVP